MADSKEQSVDQTSIEHAKQLSKVSSALLNNIYGLINDLDKYSQKVAVEQSQKLIVEQLTRKIVATIDEVNEKVPELLASLQSSENEKKVYGKKLEVANEKLLASENQLEEATNKVKQITEEMNDQSAMSALMGQILGMMIWKTSQAEEIIDVFICKDMIEDFLSLAQLTMKSFIETYSNELPYADSNEYKFAVSILGITVNISAQQRGRDFMLEKENGLVFVEQILNYVGSLPMPSGLLLKRMCLIFLHNIGICKRGAYLFKESECGVKNILSCLGPENTSEIHQVALNLIISLLDEIPSQDLIQKIKQLTSTDHLQEMMLSNDDGLKHFCKKFCSKIGEDSIF